MHFKVKRLFTNWIFQLLLPFFRFLNTRISRWFLSGVLAPASLHVPLGLFTVFWLISVILQFWWSPLLLFPNPPVTVPILWWQPWDSNHNWYNRNFHVPWLFFSSLARYRNLSFFLFSFNFTLCSAGTVKFTIRQVLFCLLIITRSCRRADNKWFVCSSKSLMSSLVFVDYH